MRLYAAKIRQVSEDMVAALLQSGAIEADDRKEVVADVESVFKNYLDLEKAATDHAREVLAERGLAMTEFARIKKLSAEQKGIKVGDDTLDHLLEQVCQMMLHSANVGEVFAPDHELRRLMRPMLSKALDMDAQIEEEVRGKLKHVTEGTRTWEIEYQRMREDIQRRKGL